MHKYPQNRVWVACVAGNPRFFASIQDPHLSPISPFGIWEQEISLNPLLRGEELGGEVDIRST